MDEPDDVIGVNLGKIGNGGLSEVQMAVARRVQAALAAQKQVEPMPALTAGDLVKALAENKKEITS